tara:strand:- start:2529 stop:3383 length:855 start_codon:yes stop_codon:yes gene_type:complete
MAKFYLGDVCLPPVASVRDVFDYGRALYERGIPVLLSEERFLRQVTWCMLQEGHDAQSDLHLALRRIAALTLAIIEDEDLSIPEGYAVGDRQNLEALALRFHQEWLQNDRTLGAALGTHELSFETSAELDEAAQRLLEADSDEPLRRAFAQGAIFLRQGEELFARHEDPARRSAHELRLRAARERLRLLLGRLLGVPAHQDHKLVRSQLVRRELRHVEIDALGAKRITEAEQAQQTKRLLRWTEADLGEELTEENKAQLAAQLQEVASGEADEDSGEDWLFGME